MSQCYIARSLIVDVLLDSSIEGHDLEEVVNAICAIPAADVRPVVKAYWIGEGGGYADGEMVYDVWSCSNCGYIVDEGDNEPPQHKFCPNCGADMREV